jgi:nucleoid-associated protein YgaU
MTADADKPVPSNPRDAVKEQAAGMSPASRADFTDVSSHVSAAIDETTIHRVAEGETLATIASRYYGKANAGMLIFDANRDQLTDPDRITSGQMLKIPARPQPGDAR